MKRILIALVIGAFALTSCKKDHSADYVFEGYQWVSEDLAANSEFPEGRILLDVGLTKPGYLSTAYIMNEAIPGYEAGVPILMTTGKYTYDSATGVLTAGTAINSGVVTFLAADKIKYESEGTVMVFTRLDKPYKLGGQNVPFQLTAEKQSDWAGGEVKITANRAIKYASYNAIIGDDTITPSSNATLSRGEDDYTLCLSLGLYKDNKCNLHDVDVVVSVETKDGASDEVIVRSKAWRPALFTNDVPPVEINPLTTAIPNGSVIKTGVLDKNGNDLTLDPQARSWSGILFVAPEWLIEPDGASNCDGDWLVCDVLAGTGAIEYKYGSLTQQIKVKDR